VVVILDQPRLNSFLPFGEQNRFIPGAKISEIPVADVYRAARELLAISRTDQLFSHP